MLRFGKHGLVFLVIAALVFVPFATPVLAGEVTEKEAKEAQQTQMPEKAPDIPGDKMIADVVFVRPMSFVATAVTSTIFVMALPFTILGGNTKGAYKELVAKPAAYTFDRKLGDF